MISKMLTLAKNWRKRGGKTAAKIVFSFSRAELFDLAKKNQSLYIFCPLREDEDDGATKKCPFSRQDEEEERVRGTGRYVYRAGAEKEEDAFPSSAAHDLGLKLPSLPTGLVMRCVRGGRESFTTLKRGGQRKKFRVIVQAPPIGGGSMRVCSFIYYGKKDNFEMGSTCLSVRTPAKSDKKCRR